MQLARRLLALVPLLGLAACGDDSDDPEKFSDHYQPSQLNASYGAFAEDGKLRILAALLGEKGFVRLRGGDTIEIEVDGQKVATRERILEDKVHTIAELDAPPGDIQVAVTFVRGVERVVGRMKIAAAFNVVAPPASIKKGQAVDLDIDPRPDLSKWPGFFGPALQAKAEVSGTCILGNAQLVPLCTADSPTGKCNQGFPTRLDTAKLLYEAGTQGCEIFVQFRLVAGGEPFEGTGPSKQAFKGGGFEGHRLVTFESSLVP